MFKLTIKLQKLKWKIKAWNKINFEDVIDSHLQIETELKKNQSSIVK